MSTNTHPIDRAAFLLGGRAAMAKSLGVTSAALGNWKQRSVPIEHCPVIERLTGKAVRRQHLRPDDWHLIWPELVDSEPNHPPALTHKAQAAINTVAPGVAHA